MTKYSFIIYFKDASIARDVVGILEHNEVVANVVFYHDNGYYGVHAETLDASNVSGSLAILADEGYITVEQAVNLYENISIEDVGTTKPKERGGRHEPLYRAKDASLESIRSLKSYSFSVYFTTDVMAEEVKNLLSTRLRNVMINNTYSKDTGLYVVNITSTNSIDISRALQVLVREGYITEDQSIDLLNATKVRDISIKRFSPAYKDKGYFSKKIKVRS